MTAPIRPAAPDQLDRAAEVLAAAFEDYPWTRWALPNPRYRDRLREVQRLYLGHAHAHGRVLVDEQVRAVAALLPPDAPEPDAAVQERIAQLHGDRLEALLAVSVPAPPDGAWTLATLGVDPAHQGRGLGSALLAAALAHSDAAGAPLSLETSDERNVRLYTRHGFRTDATVRIPEGPIVHAMHRDVPLRPGPGPAGPSGPGAPGR